MIQVDKASVKGPVLIIEDTEDNEVLIAALLRHGGYKTVWASTGESGVEMVRRVNPEFVILDIQLPDIDGFEALRRIRASEAGRVLPVIAMTSHAMAGDRERLMRAGCTGYIEKPFDPGKVLDQIHRILSTPG
jgi:CheY-like chemotaxis protein